MVSTTTTTTNAAGQPTSSANHHSHHQQQQQSATAATLGSTANTTATANNSNYQRSTSQQQQNQQQLHTQSYYHPSSSTAQHSYYNSLALNGVGGNNNSNNNNNSNSSRNANVKSRVTTKTTGALSAGGSVAGQESVVVVGDHNTTNQPTRPSPIRYNGAGNTIDDSQSSSNSSSATPTTTTTVTATTTNNLTRALEEETASVEQQPQSHETPSDTKSPTTTATAATVNLSQALLSSSPPLLNDQISLLFPKCRPRQLSPNGNQPTVSRNSSIPSKSQSQEPSTGYKQRVNSTFDRDIVYGEPAESTRAASQPPPPPPPVNYYKSVNIITQSPPPPSTSSVSSESLSSVTPRISTNPFLNHIDSVEDKALSRATRTQHKFGEEDKGNASGRRTHNDKRHEGHFSDVVDDENINNSDNIDDEELPVPSYPPTFYYHTETKHSQGATRQRHHQTGDNSNSYEMPRKRATYGSHHHPSQQSYAHYTNSSTQQQQLQHKQSNNHNGTNVAAGSLNQNPFIKDGNYWDTVRHGNTNEAIDDNADTRLPSHYNELADSEQQHDMATPVGTQSSGFGSTATTGPIATAAPMSSVRRSYHQQQPQQQQQQPYTNSSYNMPTRQHHQQQHISRLGRNTMEPLAGEQFVETTAKRGYHVKQQQRQQHNSLQAVQDSCAEGLTPLASHYLYGSKTSLDQQQHVISVSDNSILVEREIRERDREQREQRKAAAAYGEWEREREREREWELECERERERDRERERGREKEKGREREKEREHEHEREQTRCRDPYSGGSQHYQAVKYRNSMKNSNVGDTNGHTVASNGEMVVFDDITESWQNLRVTTDTSAPPIPPASTRQQLQQQHHRQPTSLTLVDNKDDYVEEDLNDQHGVVEVTGSHKTSNNNTSIMYKDHQKRYLDRSSYTMRAVETRHGIIEYEGSPRRIGGQAGGVMPAGIEDETEAPSAAEEELEADAAMSNAQQTHSQQQLTKTATTTNASNNGGGGISQHTNATTTTHNSPQQQYPARPGFPQRIISPPRESTPPIMLLSHSNSKQQQQQQQQDYQQPQTLPQRQSSPPTTCTLDNNAEDTSNDVSEIGTISDLTTPDAISTTGVPTTPTYTIESPAINASHTTTMPPSASNAACKPLTTIGSSAFSIPTKSSTFDYLYEFSETRKVLEEFFKCPSMDDRPLENGSDVDSIDIQYEFHSNLDHGDDDELDSPSNVNIDADEDEDDEDEEDEDDDDDDGLMGVDMDGIQPQQHHHQLQQQHNNQMRQLQTTIQQRNNQRETQLHLQTSPTPTLYRQHQSEQQQQQNQHAQQYLQQQPQQQLQTPQDSRQRKANSQRQQQQLNNSSNNSNSNSNNYNNSTNSHRRRFTASPLMRDFDFFLDSASRSSGEQLDQQDSVNHNQLDTPGTYRYSPETTDYDSNCGDLDSLSGEINGVSTSCSNYTKYYASSMPVLEDGLSSGHTSDTENQNNLNNNLQQPNTAIHHNTIGSGGISMLMDMKRLSTNNSINSMNNLTISTTDGGGGGGGIGGEPRNNSISSNIIHDAPYLHKNDSPTSALGIHEDSGRESVRSSMKRDGRERELLGQSPTSNSNNKVFKNIDPELDSLYSISIFHRPDMVQMTPPPPAPAPHRKPNILSPEPEILQPTPYKDNNSHGAPPPNATSPINALGTAIGSNSGSGVTSVASAISSTLNRNKIHSTQHQSGSGNAPSVLSNALRATNQSHTQTQLLPSTQTLPSTQSQSQSQTQSQPPPPPIPERSMPRTPSPVMNSPVWLPRHLDNSANKSLLASSPGHHSKNLSADEDDVDTDLETDRLLGHQRLDDQGYYDENKSWESRKPRSSLLSKISPKQMASTKTRNGYNALLSTMPEIPPPIPPKNSTSKLLDIDGSMSSSEHSDKSPLKSIDVQDCVVGMGSPGGSEGSACISGNSKKELDLSTINSNGLANSGGSNSGSGSGSGSGTGSGGVGVGVGIGLLSTGNANGSVGGNGSANGSGVGVGGGGSGGGGHSSSAGSNSTSGEKKVKKSKNKEGGAVLIEGVLFRAKYLGSTQLVCEGQPTKSTRMMQAEEAVSRIKALAPDGDVQPSTEVDLFISTEKIMVLNTDLKEIMMDHALRTISYIADIGDLVVLMARRRFVPQDIDDAPKPNRTPKMICHVFESDEAQFIAQSIGQAFQVAYMEFLKANGIEDHSFVKEMDYQEVLNSQEIFGDELEIFAKKELQKEVVVPKAKGEILGVVIVESGWGSMLPTVVIANLMSSGAAARCGQLNIGDQLIAINGLSLVGLPLSTCQTYIKNTKNQTVVKFTVVPCAPVVEVKIKRPNTKYQLGFSVQNGVICSLLRGGIAERGGVRVGHRIIEINNQSVVAVPHEKIVNLLATSVGEILMKTMPTSMFRLLTGQENPIYI